MSEMLSEDVAWSQVGRTRRIHVLPEGRCASIGWIVPWIFAGLSDCACHVREWMSYLFIIYLLYDLGFHRAIGWVDSQCVRWWCAPS